MTDSHPAVFYTHNHFDRAHKDRRDPAWVARHLHDRDSRVWPVWRNRNLFLMGEDQPPEAVALTGAHARGLLQVAADVAFLGLEDGRAQFACDLSDQDEAALTPAMGRAEFRDLREVGVLLDAADASRLSLARGLMYWHRNHRFCPSCGAATSSVDGGHARRCGDPDCGREQFPTPHPAVIMLVTRPGPEGGACLLGRQATWPPGMMSTLAGFVDAGETLEQAVIREVAEEAGIAVENPVYMASQPWPFPSSLMLAYRATAKTTRLNVDRDELDEARWFTKAQVMDFERLGYRLPRADSVARWLIDRWLEEGP
ncbi:MAG: NAD(+) diphosphatase [Rhodobacterales bacterium]|nr:NAD(+) diphosphatase [Rhodobacterales bacterium]